MSIILPIDDELLTIVPVRTALPPAFVVVHQPRGQQEPPRRGARRQEEPQGDDGVVTARKWHISKKLWIELNQQFTNL